MSPHWKNYNRGLPRKFLTTKVEFSLLRLYNKCTFWDKQILRVAIYPKLANSFCELSLRLKEQVVAESVFYLLYRTLFPPKRDDLVQEMVVKSGVDSKATSIQLDNLHYRDLAYAFEEIAKKIPQLKLVDTYDKKKWLKYFDKNGEPLPPASPLMTWLNCILHTLQTERKSTTTPEISPSFWSFVRLPNANASAANGRTRCWWSGEWTSSPKSARMKEIQIWRRWSYRLLRNVIRDRECTSITFIYFFHCNQVNTCLQRVRSVSGVASVVAKSDNGVPGVRIRWRREKTNASHSYRVFGHAGCNVHWYQRLKVYVILGVLQVHCLWEMVHERLRQGSVLTCHADFAFSVQWRTFLPWLPSTTKLKEKAAGRHLTTCWQSGLYALPPCPEALRGSLRR